MNRLSHDAPDTDREVIEANGGPAFPFESPNEIFGGMYLRDYFAAKAMQAMVDFHSVDDYSPEAARRAYVYADAMLKERAK